MAIGRGFQKRHIKILILELSQNKILNSKKKFKKDLDNPETIINESNDELLEDQSQQDNVNEENTKILENDIEVDQDIAQEEPKEIQGLDPDQAQIECKIREQQDIQRKQDNYNI